MSAGVYKAIIDAGILMRADIDCSPTSRWLPPHLLHQVLPPLLRCLWETLVQSPFYHLCRVLERVIHERTIEFLDKHKILRKFQFCFRKNYSTDFCLLYLTDEIQNDFDSCL